MRIVQKKFTVFEFKELGVSAQDAAVEHYTSGAYPDYEWWDGDEYWIEEEAKKRGMAIKQRGKYGLDFWFDTNPWSFGFEGYVGDQSLFARELMNLRKPDMRKRKEYEYWTRFLRCVDHDAIELFFSCSESNYYGTRIESGIDNMVASESDLEEQFKGIIEDIVDTVRDFNGDEAAFLMEEYEGMFDRAFVIDEIENNELEFFDDGTVYYARNLEPEVTA
jgi:hypothetical protein